MNLLRTTDPALRLSFRLIQRLRTNKKYQRDPTRTTTIRRGYSSAYSTRVNRVRREVEKGFRAGRWGTPEQFQWSNFGADLSNMARAQFADGIGDEFVRRAYLSGLRQADARLRSVGIRPTDTIAPIGRTSLAATRQFAGVMARPLHTNTIEQIVSRMDDYSARMVGDIRHGLKFAATQGARTGGGVPAMLEAIESELRKLDVRARAAARTAVVEAHAEAVLNRFEENGVTSVTAMVEYATAGDDRVCSVCGGLEGKKYSVEDARGVIPQHPNCRCSWVPIRPESKRKNAPPGPLPLPGPNLRIGESKRFNKELVGGVKEARTNYGQTIPIKHPHDIGMSDPLRSSVKENVADTIGAQLVKWDEDAVWRLLDNIEQPNFGESAALARTIVPRERYAFAQFAKQAGMVDDTIEIVPMTAKNVREYATEGKFRSFSGFVPPGTSPKKGAEAILESAPQIAARARTKGEFFIRKHTPGITPEDVRDFGDLVLPKLERVDDFHQFMFEAGWTNPHYQLRTVLMGGQLRPGESVDSLLDLWDVARKRARGTTKTAFKGNLGGEVASDLIHRWAMSADADNEFSLAMQLAAEREFEMVGALTSHFGRGGPTYAQAMAEAADVLKQHGPVIRRFLREQYDWTQAWLKERGMTHLTVWRGMALADDNPLAKHLYSAEPRYIRVPQEAGGMRGDFVQWAIADGENRLQLQPMSSFSGSIAEAVDFARMQWEAGRPRSVVVGVRVPAKRVLSTARTGFGCLSEAECLLLGGEYDAFVIDSDWLEPWLSVNRLKADARMGSGLAHLHKVVEEVGAEGSHFSPFLAPDDL